MALIAAIVMVIGCLSVLAIPYAQTLSEHVHLVTREEQTENRKFKGYVLTQEEKQAYWDMTMNYVNLVPKATTVYNGVDYSSEFDAALYYLNYADLQKAIGADSAKLLAHYVNSGKKEGRVANMAITPWGNFTKGTVEANCYRDIMLNQDWANRYIYWLNQERAARGLGQVKLNNYLGWQQAVKSANVLLEGGNPVVVYPTVNWTGSPSRTAVDDVYRLMSFPESEPHKANLLKASATEYGIALFFNPVNESKNNEYITRQTSEALQAMYNKFMTTYTLDCTDVINQYGMGCSFVHN